MAPIDINNQEISSITLNGNTEINTVEVNGQEVFSATETPVAKSNLVWWHQFDNGSFADSANTSDFADSTPYDLTRSFDNPTFPSGGARDPITGTLDNYAAGDGTSDRLDDDSNFSATLSNYTLMMWAFRNGDDSYPGILPQVGSGTPAWGGQDPGLTIIYQDRFSGNAGGGPFDIPIPSGFDATQFHHYALTYDSGSANFYVDGSLLSSFNDGGSSLTFSRIVYLDEQGAVSSNVTSGGQDDGRLYNTDLTAQQINLIYQNTKP